jgi:hypothetical protein
VRCPECGLAIDTALNGVIPWERRKALGYFRAFVRTLALAIFTPARLARAVGEPIDLRSARLFRWFVRALVIVPAVTVFVYLVSDNGGMDGLIKVSLPQQRVTESFWEPRLLWTIGATLMPVLPIGVALTVILSTGISHWFFTKRLEPLRQDRAMAFSFYLCPTVAWIWLPMVLCTAVLIMDNPGWVDWTDTIAVIAQSAATVAVLSAIVVLLAAMNSLRAARAATHCGALRSMLICIGAFAQAVAACAIGLGLFPVIIGLFRLMITSLLR